MTLSSVRQIRQPPARRQREADSTPALYGQAPLPAKPPAPKRTYRINTNVVAATGADYRSLINHLQDKEGRYICGSDVLERALQLLKQAEGL